MSVLDEFGRSKQVSLTTFRRDGTGVATPVWHVVHDGEVIVVSNADAWKVKRIRNDARVELTACDIRGRIRPGAATASGTARLLDEAGTEAARAHLRRRYVMSRLGDTFARWLRLRRPPVIGIAISI